MVVKVARSQGHDKVSETDQRRFHISENAHDHMTAQNSHGRLAAGLRRKERTRMKDKTKMFMTEMLRKQMVMLSHLLLACSPSEI